jgi:hypothetical protein
LSEDSLRHILWIELGESLPSIYSFRAIGKYFFATRGNRKHVISASSNQKRPARYSVGFCKSNQRIKYRNVALKTVIGSV